MKAEVEPTAFRNTDFMPTCLELFSWWGGCYPSWLSREPISQFYPFLLQSQCTVECAVRFCMLSSPLNTLSRFLLKHIMSWGPCCGLFTIGWCVWQQKTNVGVTQYTNVSLTWCYVLQWHRMPPEINLQELGIQKAAWGHQPAVPYQQFPVQLLCLWLW